MFLMILCAVLAALLPPLWPGVSGRDFRPHAATMSILICVLAIVLRRWRGWSVVDFLGALLGVELFTFCVIAQISGLTGLEMFDHFNLSWLGTMSLFIAPPWVLGLALGSLWCWSR